MRCALRARLPDPDQPTQGGMLHGPPLWHPDHGNFQRTLLGARLYVPEYQDPAQSRALERGEHTKHTYTLAAYVLRTLVDFR